LDQGEKEGGYFSKNFGLTSMPDFIESNFQKYDFFERTNLFKN
jgi:hypothetical protein